MLRGRKPRARRGGKLGRGEKALGCVETTAWGEHVRREPCGSKQDKSGEAAIFRSEDVKGAPYREVNSKVATAPVTILP